MKLVRIYLNGQERITVYKEGGCQFERNLGTGFGWIVDNDACADWQTAIKETQAVLRQLAIHIELCV